MGKARRDPSARAKSVRALPMRQQRQPILPTLYAAANRYQSSGSSLTISAE
jgi:hypothetical protein